MNVDDRKNNAVVVMELDGIEAKAVVQGLHLLLNQLKQHQAAVASLGGGANNFDGQARQGAINVVEALIARVHITEL